MQLDRMGEERDTKGEAMRKGKIYRMEKWGRFFHILEAWPSCLPHIVPWFESSTFFRGNSIKLGRRAGGFKTAFHLSLFPYLCLLDFTVTTHSVDCGHSNSLKMLACLSR